MKLIFVRHGESTANREHIISNRNQEFGLTEQGIHQANLVATRLAGENVARLYTSPLLRARQTGEIIAKQVNIPHIVADELREFDCGSLEGRNDPEAWNSFLSIFQDWLKGKKWRVHMAGGESFMDITRRFIPFVEKIRKDYEGQTGSLVLVSHGGVFYTMLPLILENVSFKSTSGTIMGNTDIVIAEEVQGLLICREWCGKPVEGIL